jgi:hypothetical protein
MGNMLGRAEEEATRVRAIVVALEQEEITLNEFSEVVGCLTSESIEVIRLLLRNWADLCCEERDRLWAARLLCRRLATQTRVLS